MRLRTRKTELKPRIRDDRHRTRFFGQTGWSWRDVDLHRTVLQFPLSKHPGTHNTLVPAYPVSCDQDINGCQPVGHEGMVPRCPFLLRRPEIHRDSDTHLLRVLTAPSRK